MDKKWVLAKPLDLDFKKKFPEIPGIILQLLYNRGLKTQDEIDLFLNPDYGQDLLDPFLFPDMKKAVERIYQAVEHKEKIAIFGDYDADGVTSSAVIANVLQKMGADFFVYIPHREKEGYGLKETGLRYVMKKKVKLIITVDCAISNKKEAETFQQNGVDVILTDHHAEPPELPDVFAIINPKVKKCKYPFQELAGVGVAYKLAQAVVQKDTKKYFPEGFEKWLLDLVAVGTVTDVMPLLGENRVLVKYGLIVLNKTRRIGLKKLAQKAEVIPIKETDLINTEQIGYRLGPRINAAGRMDHANAAYQLLMTEDKNEADKLAEGLEKNNQQRQRITDKIITELEKVIKKNDEQYIVIAEGRNWPLGVIGIAAGKVKDQYNLPVFIISKLLKKTVGSGRSIPEFDMISYLQKISQCFKDYGGHAMAAGITLKNKKSLAEFKEKFTKFAEQELKDKDIRPKIDIEAELDLNELNWVLFDQIQKFEPFGQANPKPVFLVKSLKVESIRTVGSDDSHLKLQLKQENMVKSFAAIGFRMGEKVEEIKYGDSVDVVCEVMLNEFNGTRNLELRLVDLKRVGGS